jgi:hypothetical protein
MNVLSWVSPIISDMVHFDFQSDTSMSEPEDLEDVDGVLHRWGRATRRLNEPSGFDSEALVMVRFGSVRFFAIFG